MNASRTAFFLATGAAALGVGLWASSRVPSTPALRAPTSSSAVVLPAPRALGDFALVGDDGSAFTREQLEGHWSLLFAGFTHCPDVCPTTLGIMSAAAKRLPDNANEVRLLFLSVDPDRDTPAALHRYVGYFSPKMTGITGPGAELDKLTGGLGLAYMKVQGASPGDYSVDHSASIALIDPQARVAAYFQPPHQADTLAADLEKIVGTMAACPGLDIQDGWIRAVPSGSAMTAGYARLRNLGSTPLTIDGADSDAFGEVAVHRSQLVNGSYEMTPLPTAEIAPNGELVLAPNGAHLMLMQPARALHGGDPVRVSFHCGAAKSSAAFIVKAGGS